MFDEMLEELGLQPEQEKTIPTQNECRLLGQVFKRDRLLAEILSTCQSAKHLNQPENILSWFNGRGKSLIKSLWEEEDDRA